MIHSLSWPICALVAVALTGALQCFVSVERLTASFEPPAPNTSETASQTWCFRSKTIEGSLARGVRPGRKPRRQVRPLSCETA